MGKVKDREFWESARMNNYTFRQYYNRLVELSIAMFEWKNVPSTIDTRFLELALFADGKALFFYDEVLGYLTLRCALGGRMSVYRVPLDRRGYAVNGYNMERNEKNSVIIWNNFLRTNSALDCEMFAKRLYNIDRIIDVNVNAQKTPVLIVCDENQRLTMKNIYMKYEGNEPVIFADKGLNANDIKVLKTDAPYISDKLISLKTTLWNEALTYLGISNINIAKRERLIRDEITRNMGGVIANRYSRLQARKNACKEINAMFSLNMDVEYREDLSLDADIMDERIKEMIDTGKEGDNNE